MGDACVGSPSADWSVLHTAAIAASKRAYAPYSRYPVGAAALTTHGRVLTGCNVENASYGLVLCAECGVVSALLAGNRDGGEAEDTQAGPVLELDAERELLVALCCVDGAGDVITPCGRCRQLLWEHAAPGMTIALPEGEPVRLSELLPHAFGPGDLLKVRGVGSIENTAGSANEGGYE